MSQDANVCVTTNARKQVSDRKGHCDTDDRHFVRWPLFVKQLNLVDRDGALVRSTKGNVSGWME